MKNQPEYVPLRVRCDRNLRALLRQYRASEAGHVLSDSTVATYAANNARFFTRIEQGSGYTVALYDRVVEWFSENWPEDSLWPKEVARPPFTPKEDAADGE